MLMFLASRPALGAIALPSALSCLTPPPRPTPSSHQVRLPFRLLQSELTLQPGASSRPVESHPSACHAARGGAWMRVAARGGAWWRVAAWKDSGQDRSQQAPLHDNKCDIMARIKCEFVLMSIPGPDMNINVAVPPP